MQVTIRSRNVDVSEAIKAATHEKVQRLARHLDGWTDAEVHFSEEHNPRISDKEVCEITMRGHGHVVRAKAASPDAFTAVDRVVDKLEHQIAKLKGKQAKKPRGRGGAVVSPNGRNGTRPTAVPAVDDDIDGDPHVEAVVAGRKIIRSTVAGKPMTPEEALLQMDALGRAFFIFFNAESDAVAVVYRRDDGNIGLVDAG